jgi:hypothetical protein
MADWPPLPEISYDTFDADDESDNLLDVDRAEDNAQISFKQMEFSLKQFAKQMG